MEPVEIGSHLELLFLVASTILLASRVEAFRPFIQREGHVGDNYVELLQISVRIQMLGIGQGIAPGNVVGINVDTVDKSNKCLFQTTKIASYLLFSDVYCI